MGRMYQMTGQGIGMRSDEAIELPRINHYKTASVAPDVQAKIASMGLSRLAGNIFLRPSTRDFWQIKNGKIVRLLSIEVDDGEMVPSASTEDPQGFLRQALVDLTF